MTSKIDVHEGFEVEVLLRDTVCGTTSSVTEVPRGVVVRPRSRTRELTARNDRDFI